VSNFKLYKKKLFGVNIEIIQFHVGVIRLVFKRNKYDEQSLRWNGWTVTVSPLCVFFIVVSAFRKECITKIMLSVSRMPAPEISTFVLQL
jgi:hypothetical protein